MKFDLTQIIITIIGSVFSLITVVVLAYIQKNVKDKQSAEVLGSAVKNSLGAIQQAIDHGIVNANPTTPIIPGVSPEMAIGLQYVLDHAGAEAARFGITPEAIADKINAQIGLTKIAPVTTTQVTSTTPVEVVTTSTTPTAPGNQP